MNIKRLPSCPVAHNLSSGGRQSTEESAEGQGYRAILCEGAQQGEAPARERAR